MRIRFSLTAAVLICLGLTVPQFAVCGTYTNFDIAGSTRLHPTAVNNTGQATGWWTDSALANHGFLFQPDGSVTTFDISQGTETIPVAINGPGKIVGYYTDANRQYHGFLRNLAGQYTTINAPGAGCLGTWAESIDDAGNISGGYWDTNCRPHAFIRDASGNYTTFDIVPNMGEVSNTFMNPGGETAGSYYSETGNSSAPHGFTRDNLGNIVTFDAASGAYWTDVAGVNATGQIAGDYAPTMNSAAAPYFRDAVGNITIFSVTGFGYVAGIKDNGDAVGIYQATNFSYRGWLRNSAGVISSFKDPIAGWRRNQGTYPTCVSANGKVAGYYIDTKNVAHGFLLH